MDSAVIDFPEPDSPTIASVSPRRSSKLTPSTGYCSVPPVRRMVRSPLTSSAMSAPEATLASLVVTVELPA